jgi:glycerol-3-phosphate dehydrogenase
MTKGKALEAFPMLKSDGLVGAVVYYDGELNEGFGVCILDLNDCRPAQ